MDATQFAINCSESKAAIFFKQGENKNKWLPVNWNKYPNMKDGWFTQLLTDIAYIFHLFWFVMYERNNLWF